jgi:hypothetical protein
MWIEAIDSLPQEQPNKRSGSKDVAAATAQVVAATAEHDVAGRDHRLLLWQPRKLLLQQQQHGKLGVEAIDSLPQEQPHKRSVSKAVAAATAQVVAAAAAQYADGRGHRMLLQQPRRLLQQHPHRTLRVGVIGCTSPVKKAGYIRANGDCRSTAGLLQGRELPAALPCSLCPACSLHICRAGCSPRNPTAGQPWSIPIN